MNVSLTNEMMSGGNVSITNTDNSNSEVNNSNMDYTVSKGDCLWNIVKSNYQCSSNSEIQEIINQIIEENNIENPDLIHSGQTLSLPHNDKSIFDSVSRADEFDEWTNSEQNYEDCLNGDDVEEFQMFDLNLSTYSTDLKNFAQEYIDKYDEDGDGSWNFEEFVNMATAGEGIPEEYSEEFEELYAELFSTLNLDEENTTINAGEFASYLFMSDLDLENYAQTLDYASSLDGKLDYTYYQAYSAMDSSSSGYRILQEHRQDFYDNFYA